MFNAVPRKTRKRLLVQGNMKQTAPAQRMADFVNGRLSYDLPKSSYAPGLFQVLSIFGCLNSW